MNFFSNLTILQRVNRIYTFLRYFIRKRGFWLRCLLCWGIGYLTLTQDELTGYDSRFNMRGNQTESREIVLLTLNISDVRPFSKNMSVSNENAYWDKKIWLNLLSNLQQLEPQKIGVSFDFEAIHNPDWFNKADQKIIYAPNVIWPSKKIQLLKDDDGMIRRFSLDQTVENKWFEQVSDQDLTTHKFLQKKNSVFINFRGDQNTFRSFRLEYLLNNRIPKDIIKNKIVIIGLEPENSNMLLTPLGLQSKTHVLAHMIDNIKNKRWIERYPALVYSVELLLILLLSVFIILQYPQTVALVFLVWISTLLAALSAWFFDSFYFWTPAISPIYQIIATWIIFIGYQATKIEQRHWQLQQEQKNLSELEQLKNNFVSLISHDLKTPIAKIQAIVDRLSTSETDPELASDLKVIRHSSEELNKYIQSILKLLRVESRDFKIQKEVIDINQVIEEAVLQLRALAEEKDIQMQIQLEPMFSIEADETLIKEVIINLIENAIKYTPENGQIYIQSYEENDRVYFSVKDTGEGINQEEAENVWGKFVRGKNQDLKTKGTGLGLYLVKYFIELHGGQVSLNSQIGIGTEVSFSLPLDNSDEGSEANANA